jgi:uncharacterized membrane protein YfcA
MPPLAPGEWLLLAVAAMGIGIAKSGLSGFALVHVLVFAFVFGARASTGILLPLLLIGDVCAVTLVGREVQWADVRRLLPPALVGLAVGWLCLGLLDEAAFRPIIGWIVLFLAAGQLVRMWRPDLLGGLPQSVAFAHTMGVLAGGMSMLANAAGPIVALYLLAVARPKMQLVATGAWFFLTLNLLKVPLSASLGLLDASTLLLDLALAPCVLGGVLLGRAVLRLLPQRLFDTLLLIFAAVSAIRLVTAG